MASVSLSESALASLKKALRKDCPHVRSSHLYEALAVAAGFRTYAALLSEAKKTADDPCIYLLDDDRFDRRLQELGYPPETEFSFDLLDEGAVIPTKPLSSYEIEYRSLRAKAWRNLMVCTINEGIRQKLFSLRAYDNRWPGADPESQGHRGTDCTFPFRLPDGTPALGYVVDAGFGELSIHVAVKPIGNRVRAHNAGFTAGDAFATGWLERKDGAWLQSSEFLHCREALLQPLAQLEVSPVGYGDRGRVIL